MSKVYVADKETLDEVKANTEEVLHILGSDDNSFGFIEHMNTLSPTERIEYIGINKNYTPMSIDDVSHEANYGDWGDFEFLKKNKPYMVKSDGTVDYELCATDYTKKADGVTASDVANTSYAGGAFAWIPRIYKKEEIVNNDRIVRFSMEEREGFDPTGFIDGSGNVLEGVWLPMFYASVVSSAAKSVSGTQPSYGIDTAAQKTAVDNFGTQARFLGGAIVNTIADILTMLGKSSDIQEVFGYGNMSGYDSTQSPTYGVKANAVVGGGQFYGTFTGTDLNKILHSIVLGSYQQWTRDPYTISVSGKLKVSPNYVYAIDASGYQDADMDYTVVGDTGWHYPHKYKVVPGFGAIPDWPMMGSTVLGQSDGFIVNAGQTSVGFRFGNCDDGRIDGVRALSLYDLATYALWNIGFAILLLPPVGEKPEEEEEEES